MRRWFSSVVAGAMLLAASQVSAQEFEVDLALVLAIDCSFSVDFNEFKLQMEGLGQALQRPEVKKAIRAGKTQRIAVTAMQWSDEENQVVILPWTIISGDADADETGKMLARMPRRSAEGGTSISAALLFSEALFSNAPSAERRVIDVSTDGRNNVGPSVADARDRVLAKGITINGLTILNEWPTLDKYFESQVAGGAGYFVMPTADYETYAEAIYRKLLKEITGPGVS